MRWFNVDTFFQSIRPVYLGTRMSFVQFETINFKDRTVRRTLFDQCLFVLTVIVDLYLTTQGIRIGSAYLELTDSFLMNVGCYGGLVVSFIFSMTVPVFNSFNARVLFEMLENLSECDEELRLLGFSIDYRKHHFLSTIYVTTSAAMGMFILVANTVSFVNDDWLGVAELYPNYWSTVPFMRTFSVLGLFVCCFSLTLVTLKHRFFLLNRAVAMYFEETVQGSHRYTTCRNLSCHQIKTFAYLHDRLSDTVELFNYCFTKPGILAMSSAFGFTVFSLFGLIHAHVSKNGSDTDRRLSWAIMMFDGFYLSFIIQMVLFSSMLSSECQRTSVVVHRAICYGTHDRRTLTELRIFSLQLDHHSPKVSCGLFDYDWKLFYAMAGSLTTYLVVLLQFDLANFNDDMMVDHEK